MKEIVKNKFKLRQFTNADAISFMTNINTESISRDTTIELPWTLDKISWWISFINDAALQAPIPEIHFVIEIDGKLAGSTALINIDEHRGELGYWIADEHSGKGIMTEAINETIKYGFEKIGLIRIYAPVLAHNKASMRVLEKNGFELEGISRKYFKKDGKYIDASCYAKVQ